MVKRCNQAARICSQDLDHPDRQDSRACKPPSLPHLEDILIRAPSVPSLSLSIGIDVFGIRTLSLD
jgi:hypothetical protein